MKKIIRNNWQEIDKKYSRADILNRAVHPEGLDITRFYIKQAGEITINPSDGHILSIINGKITLRVNSFEKPLYIEPSAHVYVPPDENARLEAAANTQYIQISGPSKQARGKKLVLRDAQFMKAAADNNRFFRWVLTPQYLSRRILLYHDQTLLSKHGDPIGWFNTTMFDVNGLPSNGDGLPVFKMQYDNQTEANVCFNVSGKARVRMAYHPYSDEVQKWAAWKSIDDDTTYYLNEGRDDPGVEWYFSTETDKKLARRNKHEVYIPKGGYVTLCCLFDPAPTGTERHLPGKYSSYQDVNTIIDTDEYSNYLEAVRPIDEMIDTLSLQKALDELDMSDKNPLWIKYQEILMNQKKMESQLIDQLREERQGREDVVGKWITQ